MMKALVKLIFFSLVSLIIVALIAPSFIDWNRHKAEVMAQISPYFQRKVDVSGSISLKILPQPEIQLEGVSIAGAEEKGPPVLTLKSLEARIKLQPLLEGRVEVEKIALDHPVLNFTVGADGKTSLSGIFAPSTNISNAASAVQLNEVTISEGTLNYTNPQTGVQKTFENLNLNIRANTLLGPYKVAGEALHLKEKIALDIETDLFNATTLSAPARVRLPGLSFAGDISLQSGLEAEGELTLAKKPLAEILNKPSLDSIAFLKEPAELSGTLLLKGGQIILNDLKAAIGKGTLKGKAELKKNAISLDLEGSNLTITSKASDSYMELPGGNGSVRFKGKNLIWGGRTFSTLDADFSYNDKEWTLKNVQTALPGDTQVILAGTITPKTNSASYSTLKITSADLGKAVDALAPDETSILKLLGGAEAPVKKMTLTGSAEASPARISLFNIDATVGEKTTLSGVINIDRLSTKPNVTAKVNLAEWNTESFSDTFVQGLMKSESDLEVTATNLTKGGLNVAALTFKGKTNGQGVEGEYTLKTSLSSDNAKEAGLPPLTMENLDLKGTLKGAPGNYTYTAEGTADKAGLPDLQVEKPALKIESPNPAALKLSLTEGVLAGGKLAADIGFSRNDAGVWSGAAKGVLKDAEMKALLPIKGISGSAATVEFDLASPDNTAAAAAGSLQVQAGSVVVENYSAEKVPALLKDMKALPENLQEMVNDAFHAKASTTFKDVKVRAKLEKGKVVIDELKLAGTGETLALTGSYDTASAGFDLSGDITLKDLPSLKVKATEKSYNVEGGKALEEHVIKNLPPPPPPPPPAPEPAPVAVTPPATVPETTATPPATEPGAQKPIQDILQRLDEDDEPETPEPVRPPMPAAEPSDSAPPVPDDAAPVPLTAPQ